MYLALPICYKQKAYNRGKQSGSLQLEEYLKEAGDRVPLYA